MSLRSLATKSLASPLARPALRILEWAERLRPDRLRILTWHRVPCSERFEEQARFLARHFHLVSPDDLRRAIDAGTPLAPRSLLITFDDAYRDFSERAWPVLRELGAPATVFVATGYPDHPERVFWWDRLTHALRTTARRDPLDTPLGRLPLDSETSRAGALKQLKLHIKTLPHAEALELAGHLHDELAPPEPRSSDVLGWDELRRLAKEGVTLGAHTRNHPVLRQVDASTALREVLDSLDDLEREIGHRPEVFAWPDGQFRTEILESLREAGIRFAFTTKRGVVDIHDDEPLLLRRIDVTPHAELGVLRARLTQAAWRGAGPRLRGSDPVTSKKSSRREALRSTVVYKSLDAALTAPLRPQGGIRAELATMVRPRSSNYARVGALVRLAERAVPKLQGSIERRLTRLDELPFATRELRLLDYGSGATVWLLTAPDGQQHILKCYRRTLARGTATLLAAADDYRTQYRNACRTYEGIDGLLPRSGFLLLASPLRGQRAVGCLQELIEGEQHDVFSELSETELVAWLGADGELCRNFERFVECTSRLVEEEGRCVDLLGHRNLLITEEDGRRRLRLVDFRAFDLAELAREKADVRSRLDAALEKLTRVAAAVRQEPLAKPPAER